LIDKTPGEAAPAEVIQRLDIKVMASTSGPALAFEPARLDLGVLLVNDQTTKEVTLVNNSDSDIAYELLCATYAQVSGPIP
jgi:hypothetical protein